MSAARRAPLNLSTADARRIWLRAQRLDAPEPFGTGPEAVRRAVEHLGYVQIDTIHVIERAHHHILWSRIPGYRRADLHAALSRDKSVFEYWTHALAYVPTRDFRYFLPEMKRRRETPGRWFGSTPPGELRRVLARIRRDGPLSIRDFDDTPVEKDHLWASRKPSKRALECGFHGGALTISARSGMLKTYELTRRHFGWDASPRPASPRQVLDYLLDRALGAQGAVCLDSICYLDAARKPAMAELIAGRVRRRRLLPVALGIEGAPPHWITPEAAADPPAPVDPTAVHILSPFDPLVIQRRRLGLLFGYDHVFEAYVPEARRRFGYFALPVLVGDRIAAAIDTKADRSKRRLEIRQWTWTEGAPAAGDKAAIEAALHRFEAFQFAS